MVIKYLYTWKKIIKMRFLLIFFCFQIIDPYVEVEIIGLPGDCCKQQTRVVDDNGVCVFLLQYASE